MIDFFGKECYNADIFWVRRCFIIMRLGRIQNNYSLEGFQLVKEQQLSFVEVCCNSEEEALNLVAKKADIKKAMEQTGIDVSSIGRWGHGKLQENGIVVPERKESYFKLLDAAMELGANTFVCGINYDDSISLYRNYVNAVDFFGELTDRSKDNPIKVALHNCDWDNFVIAPKQWEVLLSENPDLYIKFDPSHSYNHGENYLDVLSDWCERVAHMHIKGTCHAGKRWVDDPPAGMDDIQWPSLFAILYARGYDGDLSIEPHSATWSGELGNKGVLFTRDYIKQFLL